MRYIRSNIINPISPTYSTTEFNQVVTLQEDTIASVADFRNVAFQSYGSSHNYPAICEEDYSDCFILPGFIDLHVHLSQFRIRGIHKPALLPWLSEVVFPEEARSADWDYAFSLARDFFAALAEKGTTCAVIYTAPFELACEAAFKAAEECGIRALIGMTMMDQNSPKELLQTTAESLQASFRLYEKWHAKTPLLDYIFTPRFAPTCSLDLMREVASFARKHRAWIQTHLSENKDEISWVRQLFGLNSYTEVYDSIGLLGSRSLFAHAIHLSEAELNLIKERDAKIVHCPDSNFYLKSGEFEAPRFDDKHIAYGLGSDVGAGTNLCMPYHAKLFNFRQSSYPINPQKGLFHITLGSAEVLQQQHLLGSISAGKQADLVIIKPPKGFSPSNDSLSQLMFFGEEWQVVETIVAGKTIYKSS